MRSMSNPTTFPCAALSALAAGGAAAQAMTVTCESINDGKQEYRVAGGPLCSPGNSPRRPAIASGVRAGLQRLQQHGLGPQRMPG